MLPRYTQLPIGTDALYRYNGYNYMTSSDKRRIQDAWRFFEEVFAKNLEVAAARRQQQKTGYYVFTSHAYRQLYNQGEQLHVLLYPEYDWSEPYTGQ